MMTLECHERRGLKPWKTRAFGVVWRLVAGTGACLDCKGMWKARIGLIDRSLPGAGDSAAAAFTTTAFTGVIRAR
jgi:hypothetical protein